MNIAADLDQKRKLIGVLKDLIRKYFINSLYVHKRPIILKFKWMKINIISGLNNNPKIRLLNGYYCYNYYNEYKTISFDRYFHDIIKTEDDLIKLQKLILSLI